MEYSAIKSLLEQRRIENDKNKTISNADYNSDSDINDLLIEINLNTAYKGILYSEIFGAPKCRRRGR
jgi:hypothetical protein